MVQEIRVGVNVLLYAAVALRLYPERGIRLEAAAMHFPPVRAASPVVFHSGGLLPAVGAPGIAEFELEPSYSDTYIQVRLASRPAGLGMKSKWMSIG